MMDRQTLLAGTGAVLLAAPPTAEAQPAAKVPRIGFLGNSTAALEANLVGPFREGLRELGYVEGRNILIEYRWAEGQYERFPALIAELIALKVDVIVTAGTPAALAVKKATTSIPLVMAAVGDPIGVGLVASLARPGGIPAVAAGAGGRSDPVTTRQTVIAAARLKTRGPNLKVRELMTSVPITVPPDTPIFEARRTGVKERIRHLLVTEGRSLVGIVTDRDFRLNPPSQATSLSMWEANSGAGRPW